MQEPALGMIEFKSVAKGIYATDFMVKKAPIRILETHPICPGKYMTLICGEVADVEEAIAAGMKAGDDLVIQDLFIPNLHQDIIPAITATTHIEKFGAIGVVETFSIATCVVAADFACKEAPIKMVEIRLANGLGGKAYFVMTGELYNVEASIKVAADHVRSEGMLACSTIIADPHPDLIEKGVYW